MEPRLSAVTLAVRKLAASRAFYETLGWRAGFANDDIAFYQANGLVLILWDATAFVKETGLQAQSGGMCLAYNVPTKSAVVEVLRQAKQAGATVQPATDREWGGTSGHFTDPDGHVWEVAWNPHWRIDGDRTLLA